MLPVPSSLPLPVKQLLNHYLCLNLGGKCVPCPYYQNKEKLQLNFLSIYQKLFDLAQQTGKGIPQEIEQITIKLAQQSNFHLQQATIEQIRQFMRRKKNGIDCSGLAYHLLKAFHQTKTTRDFDQFLKRSSSPNPLSIFRPTRLQINTHTLTSTSNSIQIHHLKDIQPGDMIRMLQGKHILIILENTPKAVTYAHSSRKWTQITGVHLGEIKITHPHQGLERQNWQEKSKDNQSFKKYYQPQQGDGVFRLKFWT